MFIDYPTAESYAKFNQRKAMGIIPSHAKIGGKKTNMCRNYLKFYLLAQE
jgi:hypothetical protein